MKMLFNCLLVMLSLFPLPGISQQTELISDLTSSSQSSFPSGFTFLDNKMFFAASSWSAGSEDRELYVSDGTTAGTLLLKDIIPGISSCPDKLIEYDNYIYFVISDSSNGVLVHRPWVTDGTMNGTYPLLPLATTAKGYTMEFDPLISPEKLFVYRNGFVYFKGRKDNAANDFAIFKSDGSFAGTLIAAELPNTSVTPNLIEGPLRYNDSLYFSGTSNGSGQSCLYKFSGTLNSITLVKQDISIHPEFGSIQYDNKLFFCGEQSNGAEVWVTDGTSGGTYELSDLRTDSGLGSWPGSFIRLNDCILFIASSNGTAIELYSIDSAGVNLAPTSISTISFIPLAYRSNYFTRYAGKLFFTGNDFLNGTEVWSTNGTTAGTAMAVDLFPGTQGSDPQQFIRYCGDLYFSATNPNNGNSNALFRTDGSAAGTQLIPGTAANPFGSRNVIEKFVFNGVLFFNGKYDGSIGNELYAFDAGCAASQPDEIPASTVSCSPNPCTDILTIRSSQEAIDYLEVIDMQGRKLISQVPDNGFSSAISFGSCPAGIYLIRVQINGSWMTRKAIKL